MNARAVGAAPAMPLAMELRRVLGAYPTGVTVITTRDADGKPVGMTANSFASVSLEPALILWSVRRSALGFEVYRDAEYFAVNILSENQADVSNLFARTSANKFDGITISDGAGGAPLIAGTAAQLECRTWNSCDGGDHLIIIGEVLSFRRENAEPLVFAGGRYARIADIAPELSDEVWPMSFF